MGASVEGRGQFRPSTPRQAARGADSGRHNGAKPSCHNHAAMLRTPDRRGLKPPTHVRTSPHLGWACVDLSGPGSSLVATSRGLSEGSVSFLARTLFPCAGRGREITFSARLPPGPPPEPRIGAFVRESPRGGRRTGCGHQVETTGRCEALRTGQEPRDAKASPGSCLEVPAGCSTSRRLTAGRPSAATPRKLTTS